MKSKKLERIEATLQAIKSNNQAIQQKILESTRMLEEIQAELTRLKLHEEQEP